MPLARLAGMLALLLMLMLGGPLLAADSADFDARAVARMANPPLGLPPLAAGAPPSAATIALGRKLFFDRRLSRNKTMSCGMCHVPEQGFTQHDLATPIGVKGARLMRNAPSLYNVAYQRRLFHDAREESLELQVLGPLFALNEMANPSAGFLLDTLRSAADYRGRFEAVFGRPPDLPAIGAALAAYERSLLAGDSAFDRWRDGRDAAALSADARRGYALFTGRAGCVACHHIGERNALFTDQALHNTGVGATPPLPTAGGPAQAEIMPGMTVTVVLRPGASASPGTPGDLGRMGITDRPADLYAFKTPALRNVALTAPYMHDGSLRTLADVLRFYNGGGGANDNLDPLIKPLGLAERDLHDVVAFLEALTGSNTDELAADARSGGVGN